MQSLPYPVREALRLVLLRQLPNGEVARLLGLKGAYVVTRKINYISSLVNKIMDRRHEAEMADAVETAQAADDPATLEVVRNLLERRLSLARAVRVALDQLFQPAVVGMMYDRLLLENV